ncbi:D-lactate dehydrogenase [Spiroplasma sabaudiense Ar-1343]|uniref:D-lactate dehydrogenase n=1 Tax=Spiroplasma sabaudiense Ar-1343 TaxID=1276257 RepID=W6AAQ0_9MOLU|nr:NAD(P)-dependent oxidoreductase [Spiroplasma sabaudiense]AHI53930.1 D-lactate dehydrogenase [Spiroplasma sabaudiense Ar-1343]
MKIICYGVREVEAVIFNKINEQYKHQLTLVEELLNDETVLKAKGHDAVLLMTNCYATAPRLEIIKGFGIEYLLTRTVGTNHIDIPKAQELGFKMGHVPSYSPNAISELAFSLGMSMLRNNFYFYEKFKNQDFTVDSNMFSTEARNSTIGIIGTGRIGLETAKAWKGMGANVIGYDVFKNDNAKGILEYKELDELLATSDVISLHIPYIPGKNLHFINKDSIAKMKKGAIIVNTSRGELINLEDLVAGLKSNHIKQVALDVIEKEDELFFEKWKNNMPVAIHKELINMGPRVIVTPHIAYFTDEAIKNMVETSFENIKELSETGTCKNPIK